MASNFNKSWWLNASDYENIWKIIYGVCVLHVLLSGYNSLNDLWIIKWN